MIHCEPVVERWTSPWIVGSEIATIVWSMKVIETAKIIAARISFEFFPVVSFICSQGSGIGRGFLRRIGSVGCPLDAFHLLDRLRIRRCHLRHRLALRRPFAEFDLPWRLGDRRDVGLHGRLSADCHWAPPFPDPL